MKDGVESKREEMVEMEVWLCSHAENPSGTVRSKKGWGSRKGTKKYRKQVFPGNTGKTQNPRM